jgi:hypothetical protein
LLLLPPSHYNRPKSKRQILGTPCRHQPRSPVAKPREAR